MPGDRTHQTRIPSPMGDIDVYRIRPASDRLRRTWQAEWTGCRHCPRAWTERGIWRKSRRWQLWHRDKSSLRRFTTLLSKRHDDPWWRF